MITCIDLDMDGVIVDMIGGATRSATAEAIHWLDPTRYDLGLTQAQLHAVLKRNRPWWTGLDWTPLGRDVYRTCRRSGIPVLVISKPSDACSAAGKIDWLEKHCGPSQRYSMTTSEHHLARPGSLLIDDSEEECERYREHGGEVFLWPAPHNRYRRWPRPEDVETIRTYLEDVDK